MAVQPLEAVLQHIRKLASAQTVQNLPDGQLVRSFIVHQDERAFTELVTRHGRLVLGVAARSWATSKTLRTLFKPPF
jgi:hypothetical protein